MIRAALLAAIILLVGASSATARTQVPDRVFDQLFTLTVTFGNSDAPQQNTYGDSRRCKPDWRQGRIIHSWRCPILGKLADGQGWLMWRAELTCSSGRIVSGPVKFDHNPWRGHTPSRATDKAKCPRRSP